MPLDPKLLMSLAVAPRRVAYTDTTVMHYALAAGLGGGDPAADLGFVYEAALTPLPSFATTLAFDDGWLETAGIDLRTVVHGSLDLAFERPLAPTGVVDLATAIAGATDKGPGKGGIVLQEVRLAQGGVHACTILSSIFVRGGGGFGGSVGREGESIAPPGRPADDRLAVPTLVQQALWFRLLGDRNPLHVDPAVARAAGFERPILHGACTFAVACATVLKRFAGADVRRMKRFAARFAGPLYPGETLEFSFWEDGKRIAFRAHAVERKAIVLDNGLAVIAAAPDRPA